MKWLKFRIRYLEHSNSTKAKTTHMVDVQAIRSAERTIDPVRLNSFSAENIERWKGVMHADGYAPATLNRWLNAVKAMLNCAKRWGYFKRDDYKFVKNVRAPRGRLLFFTRTEFERIMFCSRPKRWKSPYDWSLIGLLGALAGLRRGEIWWLSWRDVDFKRGLIAVTPKDGWMPKDAEIRYIPLNRVLKQRLLEIENKSEWVIWPRPSQSTMTTIFRRIIRNAGLKGSLHTLRHTFASWLVEAGVPLYTVARLLGHSNTKTTEIYAHLSPTAFAGAIDKLPNIRIM